MDPLSSISTTAASGMRAQAERLRIVSENVANSSSTAQEPGGDPYQRKTISFDSSTDERTGAAIVTAGDIDRDKAPFTLRFDPSHPAADENGYIKLPNVNPLIEMSNMREASRSYEANLSMVENARDMRRQLVDMLR
ncbi:flagellar basal body rod protein FlgC [Sulfitobacter sp. JBTF-M27]|uniref:Flagellar basal-body rod protein FlgC n=1 Tax=Sulfitobacter sediminilitoris TaxID=2698830 RepID=A0A6P0CCD4_9RHOB|nr:flagellar basal body rod protein FlgC [Sulfitobacter sediminilitoris]NEK23832.1 flagellar basal body rod protein FlgC [Sulfitobacter sediminilitoris]